MIERWFCVDPVNIPSVKRETPELHPAVNPPTMTRAALRSRMRRLCCKDPNRMTTPTHTDY
jgi:hypothetical protein